MEEIKYCECEFPNTVNVSSGEFVCLTCQSEVSLEKHESQMAMLAEEKRKYPMHAIDFGKVFPIVASHGWSPDWERLHDEEDVQDFWKYLHARWWANFRAEAARVWGITSPIMIYRVPTDRFERMTPDEYFKQYL